MVPFPSKEEKGKKHKKLKKLKAKTCFFALNPQTKRIPFYQLANKSNKLQKLINKKLKLNK